MSHNNRSGKNVYTCFHKSARLYPWHNALHINEKDYTYSQLERKVNQIFPLIPDNKEAFTGLFARKSITAYSGILAILKAGKAYVPFNPGNPPQRNEKIRQIADITTLVADDRHIEQLAVFLKFCRDRITVLLPDTCTGLADIIDPDHRHTLLFSQDSEREPQGGSEIRTPDRYAYLLFTSGSTGEPKGVPVSHWNLLSYINHVNRINDFNERDRFSQAFELTFDPSVQDMFSAWSNGSSLYSLPDKYSFLPGRFIARHKLTIWHSVPSIPRMMSMYGMLRPRLFPELRYSLFGGEPLHVDLMKKWAGAAPNSIIDNLYGPTEVTITISQYRWNPSEKLPVKSCRGVVSVGKIYPGHELKLIDSTRNGRRGPASESGTLKPTSGNGSALSDNKAGRLETDTGELLINGKQVVDSYYKNEDATSQNFVSLEENSEKSWYRTGDIMKMDEDGDLFFISRTDHQIKIRGNRVEPGEISYTIESMTGPHTAVALPYSSSSNVTEKIILFMLNKVPDTDEEIMKFCKKSLPDYMVPYSIKRVEHFPLNLHGKIDNQKLLELYEVEQELTAE